MSEVLSAIGKVEGLVDQRKVGNDIADYGALDRRPVLPRRIVRMGAMNAVGIRGFKRDQHFAAPAFDPADAALPGAAVGEWTPNLARRKRIRQRVHQPYGLEQFFESH